MLITRCSRGQQSPTAESFSWEWFNPFAIHDFSSLLGGFLVAIFIFWGSTPPWPCRGDHPGTPAQAGRGGVTAILITVVTYVVFAWPPWRSPASTPPARQPDQPRQRRRRLHHAGRRNHRQRGR